MFYWNQAFQFYKASRALPETASPLTSYYCILNATKALLESKSATYGKMHGVKGKLKPGYTTLKNELVVFKQGGVLAGLCRLLGDPLPGNDEMSIYEIFYHLPFLRRSVTLTYKSSKELFIPVQNIEFVKKEGSRQSWLRGTVNPKYVNSATARMLPVGYEQDKGFSDKFVFRMKKRFQWDSANLDQSIATATAYHAECRKEIIPIHANVNTWYLRKGSKSRGSVDKSSLPMMFAAMHRLSEMSRYTPISLSSHLDSSHNWLLTEFMRVAPAQFVYHTASEITGLEFVTPYAFRMNAAKAV